MKEVFRRLCCVVHLSRLIKMKIECMKEKTNELMIRERALKLNVLKWKASRTAAGRRRRKIVRRHSLWSTITTNLKNGILHLIALTKFTARLTTELGVWNGGGEDWTRTWLGSSNARFGEG